MLQSQTKLKTSPSESQVTFCPSLFLPTRKLSRGLQGRLETTHSMEEPTRSGTASEVTSCTGHTLKVTVIILPLGQK